MCYFRIIFTRTYPYDIFLQYVRIENLTSFIRKLMTHWILMKSKDKHEYINVSFDGN